MSFEHKIRFMSASIDPRQLGELKYRFKNDINSKRKYSQINTLYDLAGVLTTRGIISNENCDILNQICQECFRITFSDIPDALNNTRSSNADGRLPLPAPTAAQSGQSSDVSNGNHTSGGNVAGRNQGTLPSEVVDIIVAGNITEKQWRPFSRALQVNTESLASATSNEDRIQKVLSTFQKNTELHRQWTVLEFALEKIRRNDLRDQCRSIISPQL